MPKTKKSFKNPSYRKFGKDISNFPNNELSLFDKKMLKSDSNPLTSWISESQTTRFQLEVEKSLPENEDPKHVSTYAPFIFANLLTHEENYNVAEHGYMQFQTDISDKMRIILFDWLIDVHLKYRLQPETLFLSTNIVDRYLAKTNLLRSRFQLLGVTALFIASKFEEIYPPEINDFVYVTDDAYSKHDILSMENSIVSVLEFNFVIASPLLFLNRFSRVANLEKRDYFLCRYLLELAILDYEMLAFRPSIQAAASIYFARKVRKMPDPWTEELRLATSIEAVNLIEPAKQMGKILSMIKKMEYKAVVSKFKSEKFLCVSELELISTN